jgi:hypothetical protein
MKIEYDVWLANQLVNKVNLKNETNDDTLLNYPFLIDVAIKADIL